MSWLKHVLIVTICLVNCLVCVSGKTCMYPTVYNSVTPSRDNKWADKEQLPNRTELVKICPGGDNSSLVIKCKDNKGETFQGYRNTSLYHYTAVCTAGLGMTCTPKSGVNDTCPDFKVQFGCDCPTPTVSTTTPSTTVAKYSAKVTRNSQPAITNQPSGRNSMDSGCDARKDMRSIILSTIALFVVVNVF